MRCTGVWNYERGSRLPEMERLQAMVTVRKEAAEMRARAEAPQDQRIILSPGTNLIKASD